MRLNRSPDFTALACDTLKLKRLWAIVMETNRSMKKGENE